MLIINSSPKILTGYSNDINIALEKEFGLTNKYVESISLNNYTKISNCIDCGYCKNKKGCCINDDMQKLYDKFNKATDFIIISPIHFDNVTPSFLTILSRCNAIYHSKYSLNDSMIDKSIKRRVFPVLIGGSKPYENQFIHAEHTLSFFSRSINAEYNDAIKIHSTDYTDVNLEYVIDIILKNINK